jgi:large subunit ribosomal protein L31
MKKGIHPDNYRLVVFKDMSCDYTFISKSTADSKETIKWEDGNEYPLVKLDISSKSHPFYTGKSTLIDTAGRIEKFKTKYAKFSKSKAPAKTEAAPEATAADATEESAE